MFEHSPHSVEAAGSSPEPLLSAVIVTHNSREEIGKCLSSLLESGKGITMEILVIDNASSDGTAELVESRFPSVTLIRNRENLFFTKANNQGLRHARGAYVLILNPDTTLQENTVPVLVQIMEQRLELAALTCMFLNSEGRIIQTCWKAHTPLWAVMSREPWRRLLDRTLVLRNARIAEWDRLTMREVDVISSAFMLGRKSALQGAGYYDERFLLYFAEDDLCMRLRQAGFRIFYTPQTAIQHLVSHSTLRKPRMFILRIHRDDMTRYFKKHYGAMAGRIVWIAATIELLVWRMYLLARSWGVRD